ncbi:MAG TPA: VWA domain-containing protein [Acidobacteriota bacterium]|nr:VWA domain-containing protein [Acidobacteriota bacterium]
MKQFVVCLVLLSTIFLPALADDYQISVTTVNVWIKATDASGNPVTGLQTSDFEVYEDNKKMAPTCFEEVHFQMPTDQDLDRSSYSEQTVTALKRLILFLDLYNTSENEFSQIRPDLDRFMRRVHLKGWQMMMAAYLNTGQLGIVVPFTQSISTVRKALDQAKGNAQRDQRLARNDQDLIELLAPLTIGKQDTPDEPDSQGPGEATRVGNLSEADRTFYEMAVSNAYRQAAVFASNEKQAAEHAFAGLESFGEYYGKKLSSGEHTLILFVSGGINSDPGRRYFDLVNSYVDRTSDALDRADFTLKKGLVVKENNFDLDRLVNKTIGKLNRHNLTLYSINTRGLPSAGADITKSEANFAALDVNFLKDYQDSLAQMAEETGGFTFQNSQNFKVGFDSVLKDISHQYLICYRSPDHKKADQYHSIKVVTKKPGLKLRYRQGYVD